MRRNDRSPQLPRGLIFAVSAALAFGLAGAFASDEPAIAEAPSPALSVSAIAILPPTDHRGPSILLLDLYPNRVDACTDVIDRGQYDWQDAAIHAEPNGWRFESGRLAVFAPRIMAIGEKADGNGLRFVGARRLRAVNEVEAELP